MAESMTSRERVRRVLHGELPDRLPFNFWMDRDMMAEYDRKWGADFRLTHYRVDVIEAFGIPDWWSGVPRKTIDDGKTSWQVEPMIDDILKALDLALPDPNNPALLSDIEAKRAAHPDKAIFSLMLAPLDIIEPLRLGEHLFMDLIDYPDVIHELMRRVSKVLTAATRRVCATDIDVLYLAGDICGKNGALISPSYLREFVFDYMREAIDIAHEAGKKVFYHTDGYVLDILDIFMDYGIDGINPLEPRYNDAREFARRTNGKLMLYGGGDNCIIIPNGSVDDVRAHVRDQFDALGREGRWIFSTHDIPSGCPLENLDAMVETVKSMRYE